MQVVSQLLSKVEEGRMSRVCVRLSISCLLFIRKALPDSSFRIGRVDGVMVPLLNEDDSAVDKYYSLLVRQYEDK